MTASPHDAARELLGAYADGELPDAAVSRLRRHLESCAQCRAALAIQRSVRARVRAVPIGPLSFSFEARLAAAVDEAARHPSSRRARGPAQRPAWARRATLWSGWVAAATLALALVMMHGPVAERAARHPPMVEAALRDYRRVARSELPPACGAPGARGLPFDDTPLRARDAHLLSCWSTTLQGQPVAAWAYRWRDHVVVAYVVPESLFFRQPSVREAVRLEGRFVATDGREAVVAWPAADRGVLVVGEDPPSTLEELRF